MPTEAERIDIRKRMSRQLLPPSWKTTAPASAGMEAGLQGTVADEQTTAELEPAIGGFSEKAEECIATMAGAVVRADKDFVEILFSEYEVQVRLPISLVVDDVPLLYGQPVKYRVLQRADGTRFQRIECGSSHRNPLADEIEKALEGLPG